MRIKIIENLNKYTYNILENEKIIFSSNKKFFPFKESQYNYAWQAYQDARNFIKQGQQAPIEMYTETIGEPPESKIYDISAEQRVVDNYLAELRSTEEEINGSKNDKEWLNDISKKVEMILQELDKIRGKIESEKDKAKIGSLIIGFRKLKNKLPLQPAEKIASKNNNFEELLYEYGVKACQAIQDYHPGAICHTEESNDANDIIISEIKGEEYCEILRLKINNKMNLYDIVSVGDLASIYPIYSSMFYQKYWKPIVERVGHICIIDNNTLILPEKSPLPDVPKNDTSYRLSGFNVDNMGYNMITLSLKNPIWFFEEGNCLKTAAVQSKYTEQDYLNAFVKCIDSSLKTLFNRKGVVLQIIPLTDVILLDVDFGRGLGNVRLSESQIEIVNEV
jgi:hypothetical protein